MPNNNELNNQRHYMTEEEKGYHCPADGIEWEVCPNDDSCAYYHTKCIVFSKEGKRKYKEWENSRRI